MKNYFLIIGLKELYDISLEELEEKYFSSQLKAHPDSQRKQDQSSKFANPKEINEAYLNLKDPYLRAKHMLKLNGYVFDDASLKQKLSFSELEDILEKFEILENLNNIDSLETFLKKIEESKEKMILKISNSFSKNEKENAILFTIKLRYIVNLIEKINIKMKNVLSNIDDTRKI